MDNLFDRDEKPEPEDNKYPLYPALADQGKQEAKIVIDRFKEKMKQVCSDALGEIYVDVAEYIETDSWTNYRNTLLDGLTDYRNRHKQGEYDFKKIRRAMFEEYREEILADIDKDHLEEITKLHGEIKKLRDELRETWKRNAY